MSGTTDIKLLLKASEPPIQNYVAALEAENLKLHKQIAKLQAEQVSLKSRVKILEDDLTQERKKPKVNDLVDSLQGKVLRPSIEEE